MLKQSLLRSVSKAVITDWAVGDGKVPAEPEGHARQQPRPPYAAKSMITAVNNMACIRRQ